ncbi:MAG: hypothetical protein WAT19_09490 [Ferruginibacter sp.]
MCRKFYLPLSILYFVFTLPLQAQDPNDTEFRKDWLLLAKLNNGFITNFHALPADMYAGGISINPQFTVVVNKLRLGANAGFVYGGKKMSGLFGPMAAFKIKNFDAKNFGGLANMHLIAEANWGTDQQQLAGGGLGFEILKLIHLSITAQRDYHLNYWWFQSHIGIKLNKKKKTKEVFE